VKGKVRTKKKQGRKEEKKKEKQAKSKENKKSTKQMKETSSLLFFISLSWDLRFGILSNKSLSIIFFNVFSDSPFRNCFWTLNRNK
jgi:hypothetical protein